MPKTKEHEIALLLNCSLSETWLLPQAFLYGQNRLGSLWSMVYQKGRGEWVTHSDRQIFAISSTFK